MYTPPNSSSLTRSHEAPNPFAVGERSPNSRPRFKLRCVTGRTACVFREARARDVSRPGHSTEMIDIANCVSKSNTVCNNGLDIKVIALTHFKLLLLYTRFINNTRAVLFLKHRVLIVSQGSGLERTLTFSVFIRNLFLIFAATNILR